MKIQKFLKESYTRFIPKTPNSALAAVEKGILPGESFIYTSLQSTSPFETPGHLEFRSREKEWDRLHELERILARQDLDNDTEYLLMYTFEKLIQHRDPEVALFAAESINALEQRYNKRIQYHQDLLKNNPSESGKRESLMELVHLYYNFASLNRNQKTIYEFYNNECLSLIETLKKGGAASEFIYIVQVDVLLRLKCFESAREALSHMKKNSEIVILEARLEYESGNFTRVPEILKSLSREDLTPEERIIFDHWMHSP